MHCQCGTKYIATYKLVEKYPYDVIPNLTLYKSNNKCIAIENQTDSIFLDFKFQQDGNNNYFLIVQSVGKGNRASINKGDTIILYKQKVLIWNKNLKLTFEEI
jgi:hypothetical protein